MQKNVLPAIAFCEGVANGDRFVTPFSRDSFLVVSSDQSVSFLRDALGSAPRVVSQMLRIMRMITILIFVASLTVSARPAAQTVTLSGKDISLKQVFAAIKTQTGLGVFYNEGFLEETKSVSVEVNNMPLEEFLEMVLKEQPIHHFLEGNTIIIFRKPAAVIGSVPPANYIRPPSVLTGRVRASDGSPLAGITFSRNKKVLGLSDEIGRFTFVVNEGDIITVSAVGYLGLRFRVATEAMSSDRQSDQIDSTNTRTRAILLSSNPSVTGATGSFILNTDNELLITLVPNVASLENIEVTVNTGYQMIPKERATGSFAQPNKKMLDARVATNILSKLEGITSGVVFNQNTMAAQGEKNDINIRGRSTIFANDQPLIVVDNFPYSGDINNINPNDVASITLLKDAAAASIWGVLAGNGVIVITTKQGSIHQDLKVTFNANRTIEQKPDLNYDRAQVNASDYIDLEQFLFDKGLYNSYLNNVITFPLISPAVEWMEAHRSGTIGDDELKHQLDLLRSVNFNEQKRKYLYRNAVNQQYSITTSGGSNKTAYFFSGGYDNNVSRERGNIYKRLTLNSQNTFRPIKNTELLVGLNIIQTENKIDYTTSQIGYNTFPYMQLVNEEEEPVSIPYRYRSSYVQAAPGNGFLDWSYNPIKELDAQNNKVKNTNIRLHTGVKYSLFKGLNAEVKYQHQRTINQGRNLQSLETYYTRDLINSFSILTNGKVTGYNVPLGAILSLSNGTTITNNVRGQLNYALNWNKHDFTALAGYELSEATMETSVVTYYGYNDDLATFGDFNTTAYYPRNPSGSGGLGSGKSINGTLDRSRSSFTNFAYTYDSRYTISGSARVDGTNYFGVATNQKSVPLWSMGAKWTINNESFYKLDFLPNLALRATYGYNGNLDRSATGLTIVGYLGGLSTVGLPYAEIRTVGNPALRWEKTAIANLGLDFSSRSNLLTGSLDIFFKKGTDIIGFKDFVSNTGISSLKGNYSDMKGHGLDLSVTTNNINKKLVWTTTTLISYAADKVTRYDKNPGAFTLVNADGVTSGSAAPVVGGPVYGVYSFKWGGLNPETGAPVGYVKGVPSENYGAIVSSTLLDELIYSGPARPVIYGGINNQFYYKGFSLAIQVNYKMGYFFRRPGLNYYQITTSLPYLRLNKEYLSRWVKPGDELHTNVPSMSYPFTADRDRAYINSEATVERGDHIRLQDVSIGYELDKKTYPGLPLQNIQFFIYSNNLGILWKANRAGIDPDVITGVPAPLSVSFGLKGSF